jgi:hypothetical protein
MNPRKRYTIDQFLNHPWMQQQVTRNKTSTRHSANLTFPMIAILRRKRDDNRHHSRRRATARFRSRAFQKKVSPTHHLGPIHAYRTPTYPRALDERNLRRVLGHFSWG